jgi:hypothetical protein
MGRRKTKQWEYFGYVFNTNCKQLHSLALEHGSESHQKKHEGASTQRVASFALFQYT